MLDCDYTEELDISCKPRESTTQYSLPLPSNCSQRLVAGPQASKKWSAEFKTETGGMGLKEGVGDGGTERGKQSRYFKTFQEPKNGYRQPM